MTTTDLIDRACKVHGAWRETTATVSGRTICGETTETLPRANVATVRRGQYAAETDVTCLSCIAGLR